jgi:hypothetical protein
MKSISGGMEQQTNHSTVSCQTRFQAGGNAMPRFYFDMREGVRFTPDRVGLELDSLDAAEQEAARAAAEVSRNQLPKGNAREVTVEAKNEHGQRVLTVTIAMMVYRVSPEPERPDDEDQSPNPWGA